MPRIHSLAPGLVSLAAVLVLLNIEQVDGAHLNNVYDNSSAIDWNSDADWLRSIVYRLLLSDDNGSSSTFAEGSFLHAAVLPTATTLATNASTLFPWDNVAEALSRLAKQRPFAAADLALLGDCPPAELSRRSDRQHTRDSMDDLSAAGTGRFIAATAVSNALAEGGVVTNATLQFYFRLVTTFGDSPNRLLDRLTGGTYPAEWSRMSLLPLAEVLDFAFIDSNGSIWQQQWSMLCNDGVGRCNQTDQAYLGRSHPLPSLQHFWHACNASSFTDTRGCSLLTFFSSLALARSSAWSSLPSPHSSTPLLSVADQVWRGWREKEGPRQGSGWLTCMLPPLLLQQEVGPASLVSPLRGPGVWSWAYAPALLARWTGEEAVDGSGPRGKGQAAHARVQALCSRVVNMTNSIWQSVSSSRAGDPSPAYSWSTLAHGSIEGSLGAAHPAALGALYARAVLAEEAGQPLESIALHRTLRSSLHALLAPWYAAWCEAARNSSVGGGSVSAGSSSGMPLPPLPTWCREGAAAVEGRVEGHPLYVLSLLSSAEALSSRGQYARAARYSGRASTAASSLLGQGHLLTAIAAGMQAWIGEGVAIATASAHCVHNDSVCRERAALSVSPRVWPAYEAAAVAWAAVQGEVRARSMEYAAFQRARAIAAFRKGWGGRMDVLQASLLSSLLNLTCPECAGPMPVLPLGAGTALGYATGLAQEGQHAQAVTAWAAIYNATSSLLSSRGSACMSDLLPSLLSASLVGRHQTLLSWAGHGEGTCAAGGAKQTGKEACPISPLVEVSVHASTEAAAAVGLSYSPWSIPDLLPAYRKAGRTPPPALAGGAGKQENLIITQSNAQQGSGGLSGLLRRVQEVVLGRPVATPISSPVLPPPAAAGLGKDRAAAWGPPMGAVSRKRKAPSSSPSPAPPSPGAAPSGSLDLTARLSEYFLRHGMSVYGCRLLPEATRTPGGRPELQAFPPVKCESTPHPLAPAGLAAMYNPAGFEDPSRRDMLTATGMTYLQALLKEVAGIEARGQAWELAVAKSDEDLDGRPYAAVGLLIPVILPPGGKPSGGAPQQQQQQQVGAVATPAAAATSRPPAHSRNRSLSSSDVMTSIITLLSAVQGAVPPVRMEGGAISNRREILEWFLRSAAGDRPGGEPVSAWSDDRLALWAHEASDRVPAWPASGQGAAKGQEVHVAQATAKPTLGPGPWAPEVLGYVK